MSNIHGMFFSLSYKKLTLSWVISINKEVFADPETREIVLEPLCSVLKAWGLDTELYGQIVCKLNWREVPVTDEVVAYVWCDGKSYDLPVQFPTFEGIHSTLLHLLDVVHEDILLKHDS